MRLLTYTTGNGARAGLAIGDQIADLAAAGYGDVLSFLEDGDKAIEAAQKLAADPGQMINRSDATLLAPIVPPKFICIGLNYRDHAIEIGRASCRGRG